MAPASDPGAPKVRLDLLLVERGLAPTRERARALILAGRVLVDGRTGAKAGEQVRRGAALEVLKTTPEYVSRGGEKLAAALDAFGRSPAGRVCLDVGASTGGFTDCLLQRGARAVYAVDVGYGQLALKLRQDPRVIVLERTNARHLTWEQLASAARAAGTPPDRPDFVTVDVSFIGLAKVLPALAAVAARPADGVFLVKPQFEAGPDQVGRGGVVRDPAVHAAVLEATAAAAAEAGWRRRGVIPSPLLGPRGNREFLMWCTLEPDPGGDGG